VSAGSGLFKRDAEPAAMLIRAAHVLDPRTGLDEPHDILIRDGHIAELGAPRSLTEPDGADLLDADGRHAFPAFVDPHVHLRTPGQEYKEDIATGTAAGPEARNRWRNGLRTGANNQRVVLELLPLAFPVDYVDGLACRIDPDSLVVGQ